MTAQRPMRKVSLQDMAPIWASDIPLWKVGARLGISQAAVSAKAKRLGLPHRPNGNGRWCHQSDEYFERIWRSGVRSAEIAQHLGYRHYTSVNKRARFLGLPSRPRKKARTPLAEFLLMERMRKEP